MFILPKEEFFKYCEFLFGLVFRLPEKQGLRTTGMFAERLSSYYFVTLSKTKKCLTLPICKEPVSHSYKEKLRNKISETKNKFSKLKFLLKWYNS